MWLHGCLQFGTNRFGHSCNHRIWQSSTNNNLQHIGYVWTLDVQVQSISIRCNSYVCIQKELFVLIMEHVYYVYHERLH